ncbi:hypothetical protein Tco_0439649 [Tanacetum coccineum]
MRTRSQSRNSNRQQQQVPPTFVEPFNLVEPIENQAPPVVTMADNRTMAQLLEAPTVGYEDAIVVPEITADNFELKHDHFYDEVPERPEYVELHQLDTFYNALNSNDQDSLNSAAGGNFLDKMPCDCLRIIESKYKVRNSRNKPVVAKVSAGTSTPGISPDVAEHKDMVKALLLDKKSLAVVLILTEIVPPMMATFTVTKIRVDLKVLPTRSGVSYQGPTTIPTTSSSLPKVVERETEVTKDTVPPTNNGSTKDVQPPVVQDQPQVPNSEPVVAPVSALMPNLKSSIPYPSIRNDERRREKANDQIEKFYEIFKDLLLNYLTDA